MAATSLTDRQIATFRHDGHVTVSGLFSDRQIDEAVADIEAWSREFLSQLDSDREAWFLETQLDGGQALRKLDNPAFHRSAFRQIVESPNLVRCVEQLIGPELRVWFSQVFLKPAGGGGPKPVHQDNFYFGPSDPDAVVTVWLALDDATVENGCLYFADGSNIGPILQHVAPNDEPFNLQVPEETASGYEMTPAPVPRGGVSFHHGNTLHQSSHNVSDRPRRAAAFHFVSGRTRFENPALEYDESVVIRVGAP